MHTFTRNAEIFSQSPAVITNQAFFTVGVPVAVSLSLLAEAIALCMAFKLSVGCWLFTTVWLILSELGLELSRAVVFATDQVTGTFSVVVTVTFTNIAGFILCAAIPSELVPRLVVACSFTAPGLAIVEVQVRLEFGRGALIATPGGRNARTGPVPLTPCVAVSGGACSPLTPLSQFSMSGFGT